MCGLVPTPRPLCCLLLNNGLSKLVTDVIAIVTAGAVGVRPSTIVCIRCAYSVLACASLSNAAQRRSSIVYISGRDRLR